MNVPYVTLMWDGMELSDDILADFSPEVTLEAVIVTEVRVLIR